jgi:hypothetical protein
MGREGREGASKKKCAKAKEGVNLEETQVHYPERA